MNDRLAKVAAYPTSVEADVVRNQLEAHGIRAIITDEATAATLWHVGSAIGGCRVLVRQEDLEQAKAVLDAAEAAADAAEGGPSRDWACPSCKEENAKNFDFCWKCNAEYPGEQAITAADNVEELHEQWPDAAVIDPVQGPSWCCPQCRNAVAEADPHCPSCGTAPNGLVNPYFARSAEPPLLPAARMSGDALRHIEQRVARAWRASVVGTFLLPPLLHLYSLYLLLEIGLRGEEMSPKAARYFFATLLLNLTVLLIAGFLGRSILRDFVAY
jgi:hypothetical protein